MLRSLLCSLRRFVRRLSWWYLTPAFVLAYPVGWLWLVRSQAAGLSGDQFDQALSAAVGKTVDPLLFFTKLGIAVAVFCLINLLGFAALRVAPVLPDWAKGHYRKSVAGLPAVPGFKGTFLALSGSGRMAAYVAIWALELLVAWGSVSAAFNIQ